MGSNTQLPAGFMSEMIARDIGNRLGTYVRSDPKNFTARWREYMRVRVVIDVCKPLQKSIKLKRQGGEILRVSVKYERLPLFCFLCGRLGHTDRRCDLPAKENKRDMEKAFDP